MSKSIFFLAFHKTASSMVSNLLLPNVSNYKHVDFAQRIFENDDVKVTFQSDGYVYGPIRLSLTEGVTYRELNMVLLRSHLLRTNPIIAMVRDPRDILVSYYHSMTKSHSISKNPEWKKLLLRYRQRYSELGLDKFVVTHSTVLNDQFIGLKRILTNSQDFTLLKYEDMISDFVKYRNSISEKLKIRDNVFDEVYKLTRPMPDVDATRHRRSGRIRGFETELSDSVVAEINKTLAPALQHFEYKI